MWTEAAVFYFEVLPQNFRRESEKTMRIMFKYSVCEPRTEVETSRISSRSAIHSSTTSVPQLFTRSACVCVYMSIIKPII
jgi:hypothetical protein